MKFDLNDRSTIKKMVEIWINLSDLLESFGARRVNIPEGISEPLFCLAMADLNHEIVRCTENITQANTSFDCYNLKTNKRIQVKACSVPKDLSSFGPKSVFDEIYLVYLPNIKINGAFSIYQITPDKIYTHKVNKNQTLKDQQLEGKRPRFSIYKDIILPNNLQPIYTGDISSW